MKAFQNTHTALTAFMEVLRTLVRVFLSELYWKEQLLEWVAHYFVGKLEGAVAPSELAKLPLTFGSEAGAD